MLLDYRSTFANPSLLKVFEKIVDSRIRRFLDGEALLSY